MYFLKKESDVDLKVKECFVWIVVLGSLMELNEDNLQMKYVDKVNIVYFFYNMNIKYVGYVMLFIMLIDKFKVIGDICMFYYVKLVKVKFNEGVIVDSWDVYIGIDFLLFFEQIEKVYVIE